MKKRKVLPPLTEDEKRRMTEIEFFIMVNHMFDQLGNRSTTYEFIEILCRVSDTSTTLIKTLISGSRAINSTIEPHIEEKCVMLYRADLPVSRISKLVGIAPKTVYQYIEKYYTKCDQEYLPRVRLDHFEHLERFTAKLKGLFRYDEHSI
jgi:hypothetical protein